MQCVIYARAHKSENYKCEVNGCIAKKARFVYMLYPNREIAKIIIKQLLLFVRPGKRPSQKLNQKKPKK